MPPRDDPRVERDNHRRAFELYYAQGEKRSFPRLATELGVSVASVKAWSRTYGWRQRVRDRDAQAARQLADQSSHRTQAANQRNLKIVHAALVFLARDITAGKLKQLGELDKLIRLEEHLLGGAESGEAAGVRTYNPVVILPDDGSDPEFTRLLALSKSGGDPDAVPPGSVDGGSIPHEEKTDNDDPA